MTTDNMQLVAMVEGSTAYLITGDYVTCLNGYWHYEGHEELRDEHEDALQVTEEGRLVNYKGEYGYWPHLGGSWVCYTDGHVCCCHDGDED
jgi:hypothetical protein